MPELTLHVGGGLTLLEEQGRERVPQAVRAVMAGKASSLENALERLGYAGVIQWSTSLRREHPRRHGLTLREGILLATRLELLESVPYGHTHVHRPSVAALRRVHLSSGGDGAFDADLPGREVQVVPLES
jgi:hypothetical protein